MIFNPKKLIICLFFFAIPLGPFAKNKVQLFSMEDLSILKNSVPEFIKTDEELPNLVISIDDADIKDGGEGAISILLKKK